MSPISPRRDGEEFSSSAASMTWAAGKLALYVSVAVGHASTAQTMSAPAFLAPQLLPPAAAKQIQHSRFYGSSRVLRLFVQRKIRSMIPSVPAQREQTQASTSASTLCSQRRTTFHPMRFQTTMIFLPSRCRLPSILASHFSESLSRH